MVFALVWYVANSFFKILVQKRFSPKSRSEILMWSFAAIEDYVIQSSVISVACFTQQTNDDDDGVAWAPLKLQPCNTRNTRIIIITGLFSKVGRVPPPGQVPLGHLSPGQTPNRSPAPRSSASVSLPPSAQYTTPSMWTNVQYEVQILFSNQALIMGARSA